MTATEARVRMAFCSKHDDGRTLVQIAASVADEMVAEATAELRKQRAEMLAVLEDVVSWAEQRCPCHNEEPKICPLCGADVDEPNDGCRAVPKTFPGDLGLRMETIITKSKGSKP